MKKIIMFLMLMLLCGCSPKAKGYASVQDKLMNMQSYRADTQITYISSNETTTYKAIQSAVNDGKYKLVTYYPENFKNCSVLFDGKMIWQYNPNVEKKININSQDKPERSQLILFSFMENYVKSQNTTVATASNDGSEYTVLEAEIQNGNKFLTKEKLWVDNEQMQPSKLIIYDENDKERIILTFNSFEYNCQFDENEFLPQQ